MNPDEMTLSGHLRHALDALDSLRHILRSEYREDHEVIEHELARAETSVRRVLALVIGDLL